MTEVNKVDDEPGKYRQLLVALIANIATISLGTMIGWQSPIIPQLQTENPPVGVRPMTDEEASWVIGITCISAAFTSLTVGTIANKFGRKVTGCLMSLPLCGCWLFTIFATEHVHLYIARFFSGISGGMVLFLVPMYVSEIASDGIRGMLGSLLVFILNGGILLAYVIGAILSYRSFAIAMLILPLFYIASFVFVPETPVYLIRRNRIDEATRSLMWFRGGHVPTVEREILRLKQEINVSEQTIKLSDLFRDRATIKGLFITLGLFAGQQMAGIFIMISYTETIFKMSGSSLSPNDSAIIVGAIQVFGSYLSTILVERAGRRPLLLTSCLGMGICHYTIGVFCYLKTLQYDVSQFSWISILALSIFMISYGLGMGPGPYIVSSEILNRDVSNVVITMGIFTAWGMAFVIVKLFPTIVDLLGINGCFFLLGSFCLIIFAFLFIIMPETKGQPRQLILDRLNGISNVLDKTKYVSSNDIKTIPKPELI